MEQVTFNNLPEAISRLLDKVSQIEGQLSKGFDSTSKPQDELLTVHQTAEFLSLAVPTVYSMVSKGNIPYMKRSKRIYFSRSELLGYLKKGRRKTNSEIKAEADSYVPA